MSDRALPFRIGLLAVVSVSATLAACAGELTNEDRTLALHAEADPAVSGAPAFPPPAPGYTRLVAPVMKDIAPGSDVMQCQYIQAPLDHDVDILDVQGHQSEGGHHAIAYASMARVAPGTSRKCTDEDNLSQGTFLGGVGGEAGAGAVLPPGVAFRLKKGQSIMLNTHFLNVSERSYDGHGVVDFKFVEVDPKRPVASLFSNGTLNIKVLPSSAGEAVAACKLPRPLDILMFANHMHDYGSSVRSEVVRADGSVELILDDAQWTYEMQFKGHFRHYGVATPLKLNAGDTLRTTCKWKNPTTGPLSFPREMCFGLGFFLSDGSTSPVCFDGTWLDNVPVGLIPGG